MTYVTEQTSAELRRHMTSLKKMPGWHDPLSDRLFKEVQAMDVEIERLRAALRKIMGGTEDTAPPFRAVPAEYLRNWALDALQPDSALTKGESQ